MKISDNFLVKSQLNTRDAAARQGGGYSFRKVLILCISFLIGLVMTTSPFFIFNEVFSLSTNISNVETQETASNVETQENDSKLDTTENNGVGAGSWISSGDFQGHLSDDYWTGEPITFFDYWVSDGGYQVYRSVYGGLEYENNINAGTATCKFTIYTRDASGDEEEEYYEDYTVKFTIKPRPISECSVSVGSRTYNGSSQSPSISISYNGHSVSTYSTSGGSKTSAGTYNITITGSGNISGSVTKSWSIYTKSITNCTIGEIGSQSYYGSAVTPVPSIYDSTRGVYLTQGSDFTLTYSSNTAPGTGSVTIKGTGNYSGSTTKSFTIVDNRTEITESNISITPSSTIYTGENITCKVLCEGTDITSSCSLSYLNNLNVGTASVSITASGNYKGSVTKSFEIAPKSILSEDISISEVEDLFFTGGKLENPSVKVRDGTRNVDLTSSEVEITYSRISGEEREEYTNLGDFEIRIEGIGNYTDFTIKRYSVKRIDLGTDCEFRDVSIGNIFTGEEIEVVQSISLKNGSAISKDLYSLLFYLNDTQEEKVLKAGNYTMVAVSNNQDLCMGRLEYTFTIDKANLEEVSIEGITSEYNGKPQEVNYDLHFNSYALIKNFDYDIEIYLEEDRTSKTEETKDSRTYYTKLIGKNNFYGELQSTFEITPISLNNLTDENLDKEITDFTFSNEDHKIEIEKITYNEAEFLSTDFILSYKKDEVDIEEFLNCGLVTIIITPNCVNLSGKYETSYNITPRDIQNIDVENFKTSLVFVRIGSTQEITLKENSINYNLLSSDYELVYENNKEVTPSATLKILGKGNYEGTKTLNFEITKAHVSGITLLGPRLTEDIYGYVYDGNAHKMPVEVVSDNGERLYSEEYTLTYTHSKGGEDFVNVGDITITISLTDIGDKNFELQENIQAKYTIENIKIRGVTLVKSSEVYSGTEKEIKILSIVMNNGVDIVNETENYKVEYFRVLGEETKDFTNAGVITIKVTATGGNYEGEAEATFEIEKYEIKTDDVLWYKTTNDDDEINFESPKFVEGASIYKGEYIVPMVILPWNTKEDKTQLVREDFVEKLEYDSTVYRADSMTVVQTYQLAGQYVLSVKIKPTSQNLKGEVQLNYQVNLAPFNEDENIEIRFEKGRDYAYTGEKIVLIDGVDFTIWYKDVNSQTTERVTTSDYIFYTGYIRVTMSSEDPSKVESVEAIEDENKQEDDMYIENGFINNLNAGKAYMIIQGNPLSQKFTEGIILEEFNITPLLLDDTAIITIDRAVYSGKEITPSVSVTINGVFIDKRNYDVSYRELDPDKINAREDIPIVISARENSNITGSVNKVFTIEQRPLNDEDVKASLLKTEVYYNGNKQKPNVIITLFDISLIVEQDYNISYSTTDFVFANDITITLTACVDGNFKGERTLLYKILKSEVVSFTLDSYSTEYTGDKIPSPKATALDMNGNELDETFYDVYFNGKLYDLEDFVNCGVKVVTIILNDNGRNFEIKRDLKNNFEITKVDLDRTILTILGEQTFIYAGRKITPPISVKYLDKELNTNEYEIAYSDNLNVGSATITINSLNQNFYGTKSISFDIGVRTLDANNIVISNITYNGKDQEVVVSLIDNDLVFPQSDFEFKIYSSDDLDKETLLQYVKDAKDYVVVLTGLQNITFSSNEKTFTVLPYEITNKLDNITFLTTYTYSGEKQEILKSDLTITIALDNEITTLLESDFDIEMLDGVKAGKNHFKILGTGNYTGEISSTFNILPYNLSGEDIVVQDLENLTYNGKVQEIEVNITFKGKALQKQKDYFVTIGDLLQEELLLAKTYKVKVEGMGNFTGTVKKDLSVTIDKFNLTDENVQIENTTFIYNTLSQKSDLEEVISVKIDDVVLTLNDYQIDWQTADFVNSGDKTFVIRGISNCFGDIEKSITISKKNLEDNDIKIKKVLYTNEENEEEEVEDFVAYYEENEEQITPNGRFYITYNNETLQEVFDYEITSILNCDRLSDDAQYILQGKGNYEGNLTIGYRIIKRPIDVKFDKNFLPVFYDDGLENYEGILVGLFTVTSKEIGINYGNSVAVNFEFECVNYKVGNVTITYKIIPFEDKRYDSYENSFEARVYKRAKLVLQENMLVENKSIENVASLQNENGEDITCEITWLLNDEPILNVFPQSQYVTLKITIQNEDYLLEDKGEVLKQIYIKPIRKYDDTHTAYIENEDGVDENIKVIVETITSKDEIKEILKDKYNENISRLVRARVVLISTSDTGDETYEEGLFDHLDIHLTLTSAGKNVYIYKDNSLNKQTSSTLIVCSTDYIVIENEKINLFLIIGIPLLILLLLTAVIITILIIRKKKKKH